jgi:uncharacterized hydrophobic protein (TIGR00341 family)
VPLRLLELTAPNEDIERLPALLKEHQVLHVWTSAPGAGTGMARVLVDAEHVETLTDALVNRLGSREGFRVILLPVEATVPRVEEPAENEMQAAAGAEPEEAEGRQQRISRDELYQDLVEESRLTWVYGVMVALSAVVAAVGLIRGDVAIIIGAMVIAPLLGPNVAVSLACTLGDLDLARRSLKTIGVGLAIAAAVSLALGAVLQFDPAAPALASRTQAGVGDIALALAAGAAGSLAFTSGVPAVLVGVMVAVALLPPLVTAGLLAGGGHGERALGAVALLVTNLTCVNLAAVATFLLQKVRPRTWWEAERAKRATRIAVTTWILMLLVLLGVMLFGHVRARA